MGRAPSLPGCEGGIVQQICKGARPIWGAPLPSPGAEGGHFNKFAKRRAPSGGIFEQICKEARPIWGAPLPSLGVRGAHLGAENVMFGLLKRFPIEWCKSSLCACHLARFSFWGLRVRFSDS